MSEIVFMPAVGRVKNDADVRLRSAVDKHYDALWRALRRLGVPQDSVEDAAQQVLLVFLRRMNEVPEGSERSFLIGSAVRVASDFRRKRSRSREAQDPRALETRRASTPDAGELLDARRARQFLDEVLAELPMELRSVFVLFEFEDMTMAAIATALGLPPGTVASRLRRARETFEVLAKQMHANLQRRP